MQFLQQPLLSNFSLYFAAVITLRERFSQSISLENSLERIQEILHDDFSSRQEQKSFHLWALFTYITLHT